MDAVVAGDGAITGAGGRSVASVAGGALMRGDQLLPERFLVPLFKRRIWHGVGVQAPENFPAVVGGDKDLASW